MGFLQNQNQTLGSSQPEVTHWESTAHLSPAVNNTIIVLGVLTFALQLCLALFFMLRCWRHDNRVREALKHPESAQNLRESSSMCLDTYKLPKYQHYNEDKTASLPAMYTSLHRYEPCTDSLLSPSIHWDLVQC